MAPLRDLAARHHLLIGASVDEVVFQKDAHYRQVLAREFSILTPENVLKFERVHPAPDRYDFSRGDALLDFANAHGMVVHGHTLVWDGQLPQWLTQGRFSKAQLKAILREHIKTVVGHYRGRIPIWDVVSEAVGEGGKLRDTFWLRAIGPAYVALAFKWAHEADPKATLLYNDYGIAGRNRKSDAVFKLLARLRRQHVPVDGVGMQMHFSADDVPRRRDVVGNMRRFESLGLDVNITELDVRIRLPATETEYRRQAIAYRSMLDACLTVRNCKSFAMWGFTDRYSWIPSNFPGWGAALPFDKDFNPKLAYYALANRLRRRN